MSKVFISIPSTSDVKGLLASFHGNAIGYCHFKSNIHVGEGITGETDLDLLINRAQRDQVLGLFYLHGFKHFRSGPQTTYPSVEDWIGADLHSRLFHLHVHWDLTLGEEFLKGYSLPLTSHLIDNRVWNSEHEIFTTSPESELLLLAIRVSLRRPLRRSLPDLAPWARREDGYIREADWLLQSLVPGNFRNQLAEIFPAQLVEEIYIALKGSNHRRTLLPQKTRFLIRKQMRPWRTYSAFTAFFRRRQRAFAKYIGGVAHHMAGSPFVVRRQPQAGGLIIAIVGPDNSGKSTQAKSAVAWLGNKIDSHYLYLGSGNGPKSWERRLWASLGKLIERTIWGRNSAGSKDGPVLGLTNPPELSFQRQIRLLFRNVLAVLLAIEKGRKVRFAVRARNRGSIVVTDRFPQLKYSGINDGPMLDRETSKLWSQWELSLLRRVNKIQPDLVIRLRVSADVVRFRAEGFDLERFHLKSKVFDDVELWPRATRIEANADDTLENLRRVVMSSIWSNL